MKIFVILVLFSCFMTVSTPAQQMRKAEEPTEVGMTSIGESYFPQPDDGIIGFRIFQPMKWMIR